MVCLYLDQRLTCLGMAEDAEMADDMIDESRLFIGDRDLKERKASTFPTRGERTYMCINVFDCSYIQSIESPSR